ncbi:DNA dC-_dU-editing enzyme APOBEC-3 isoform X1 [Mus pahari]|uniref:DNA dC->dU-editing enzyme APOBEC-3 isoform X1 n=1 Tax=Mus pahari TaxID=10093 RepID=UPI000FC8B362|nr:DNA dC->dU-editing enzyme APOBEC-3 isoform X1 [Mus pahari]
MQPQRLGPRAGMGPVCLGCSHRRRYSPIRNLISREKFDFHFKNLCYAKDRKDTFLCYEVTRKDCDSPNSLCHGVFKNKGNTHAEICFLYWFHDKVLKVLSLREEFKVTWYMSWSPCFECAEQVARFLATHHNLSLAIFSSRLYNIRDPKTGQGLCRLVQEGAQVAAMGLPEFEKCWKKFVDNDGQPFMPWKRLCTNFRYQNSKLQEILSQMSLLREEVFYLQFHNSRKVQPVQHRCYYRRKPYLCYRLEQSNGQELLKGWLLSKKGKQHAEILFLEKIRSMELSQMRITCYLTWSPCPNCAWQLAAFQKDRPDLILHIYTSRLYFHWRRIFQKGLCSLWRSGIQVDVMDLPQFTDCWTNFVNPQRPFRPWKGLEKNSRHTQRRLRRIKESWGLQDLVNDFENLQLGPPMS